MICSCCNKMNVSYSHNVDNSPKIKNQKSVNTDPYYYRLNNTSQSKTMMYMDPFYSAVNK